jgi:hypothetical protein
MSDIIIAIVAVNTKYVNYAIKLMNDINSIIKTNFLILTNSVDTFNQFSNVTIISYNEELFSYHSKLIALEEGLKIKQTVLLLDADHCLNKDNNHIDLLNNLNNIEEGLYPHFLWKHPCACSLQNFLLGLTDRVPYGVEYKQYCIDNSIKTDDCSLVQESFILIKINDNLSVNLNIFFSTWKILAKFCDFMDKQRNQGVLGYGEGYTIAISALNASLKVIDNNHTVNKIKDSFKHFAWHPQ